MTELEKLKEQCEKFKKHMKETGIPICVICGKEMEMAYDSVAKKKCESFWKFTCKCHSKNFRLALL